MRTDTFNCGWYLPPRARRIAAGTGLIIVVIVLVAFVSGYGTTALLTASAALLTAAVAEGYRAVLRLRPRTA